MRAGENARFQAMHALPWAFFFVSGFCGLLYQVVWTRLAFASFGVITPVLSVVISVFMLGLSVGSWGGAKAATFFSSRLGLAPLTLYGLAEALIGLGGSSCRTYSSGGKGCCSPPGPPTRPRT